MSSALDSAVDGHAGFKTAILYAPRLLVYTGLLSALVCVDLPTQYRRTASAQQMVRTPLILHHSLSPIQNVRLHVHGDDKLSMHHNVPFINRGLPIEAIDEVLRPLDLSACSAPA